MITTDKTAKELFHEVMANPQRVPFGFGNKAVLVNVDPQKAYTRTDLYKTAYETDPRQLDHVNQLARA
ncbi:MAG: N-carbamoylsarcosine amidohydrolase, partial [Halomonas campaniensis]